MATYLVISLFLLAISVRLIRIGYIADTLEKQMPLCKIIINVGVLFFTLCDMFKNIQTITWGLSVAVSMVAAFEIISNGYEVIKQINKK